MANHSQVRWSSGKAPKMSGRADALAKLILRKNRLEALAGTTPLEWRELAAEFAAINALANADICARRADGK